MAVSAAVVVAGATIYSANQASKAASAQRDAASAAQQTADTQAKAIQDQTAALQTQIDEQRKQMEQMTLNNNSLLTQQQDQFSTLLTQQQSQFSAQSAATQAQYEQSLTQQREAAAAQAQLAEEAKNRANQKKPVTEAFVAKNEREGLSGQSGTLLTGIGGVTTASLPLGKNTLLGS